MMPLVRAELLARWRDLGLGRRPPRQVEFLGQLFSFHKSCFFLFVDGEPAPRFIVKLPRSRQDNSSLEREYESTRAIHALLNGPLATTIPRSQRLVVDDLVVLIEPFFPGRAMNALIASDGPKNPAVLARYIDDACRWLIAFHRATRRPTAAGETLARADETLTSFVDRFGLSPTQRSSLDRLTATAATGEAPPAYFSHGHFGPENILIAAERCLVIDWDWGTAEGWPLVDLLHFLTVTYFRSIGLEDLVAARSEYIGAFDDLYWGDGVFSSLAWSAIRRYTKVLELTPAQWPWLFALYLAEEANRKFTALARRAERGAYFYPLSDRTAGPTPSDYRAALLEQTEAHLLRHLLDRAPALLSRAMREEGPATHAGVIG